MNSDETLEELDELRFYAQQVAEMKVRMHDWGGHDPELLRFVDNIEARITDRIRAFR